MCKVSIVTLALSTAHAPSGHTTSITSTLERWTVQGTVHGTVHGAVHDSIPHTYQYVARICCIVRLREASEPEVCHRLHLTEVTRAAVDDT